MSTSSDVLLGLLLPSGSGLVSTLVDFSAEQGGPVFLLSEGALSQQGFGVAAGRGSGCRLEGVAWLARAQGRWGFPEHTGPLCHECTETSWAMSPSNTDLEL